MIERKVTRKVVKEKKQGAEKLKINKMNEKRYVKKDKEKKNRSKRLQKFDIYDRNCIF